MRYAVLFVKFQKFMSFSIAAAEPWPENATLYQPLKGK